LSRLENAVIYLHELADHHSDASAMRRLGTGHRLQRCYEKAARCFQQVRDALDVFSDPLRGVALVSSGPATSQANRSSRHPICGLIAGEQRSNQSVRVTLQHLSDQRCDRRAL
jgi:hypothetical protein